MGVDRSNVLKCFCWGLTDHAGPVASVSIVATTVDLQSLMSVHLDVHFQNNRINQPWVKTAEARSPPKSVFSFVSTFFSTFSQL